MAPAEVEELARLGDSQRPSDRLRLWRDLLPEAIDEEGFLAAYPGELSALVLQWVRDGGDAPSLRAFKATLPRLLADAAVARAVAAGAVKVAAQAIRLPTQAALRLLVLIAAVISRLEEPSAHKPLVKLFEATGSCLARLGRAGWGGRRWSRAALPASITLRGPAGCARAPAALEALRAGAGGNGLLARLVAEASRAWPDPAKSEVVRGLASVYSEVVLVARETPPAWNLAGWHATAAVWDAATMAEVAQAASRAIKRSPEAAVPAIAAVLGHPNGVGAVVELGPALLGAARHARAGVREPALVAVAAAARSASSAEELGAALIEPALEQLLASGATRVKAAGDRASLLRCLLAFAEARTPAVAEASGRIAGALASDYATETSEECRLLVIETLGAFCEAGGELHAPAAARFTAGMGDKEKDAVRIASLRATTAALGSPSAAASGAAEALVAPTASLLAAGASKATLRTAAPLGALALARLAAGGHVFGAREANSCGEALTAAADKVFAPQALAKLAAEDAQAAAQACAGLLALGDASPAPVPARPALLDALARLLLHHDQAVRRAAEAGAAELAQVDATAPERLLDAFARWVAESAGVPGAVEDRPADAPDVHEGCLPARYYHALMAALPPTGWQGRATPGLLLSVSTAAHAPILAAARRGGGASVARAAFRRVPGASGALEASAGEAAAAAVSALRGTAQGSASRVAALGALSSLAGLSPERVVPALLSELSPLLDAALHDTLSARELRAFFTPAGRVSNEAEDGSLVPAEIFEQLLLSGVGTRGGSDAGATSFKLAVTPGRDRVPAEKDEGRAPAPRPSSGAARASARGTGRPAAAGKDAAAVARAKQLETEAEVRARVTHVAAALADGADGIAAVARGAPAFLGGDAALERSARRLEALAGSPLVGDGPVLGAMTALAACMGPALVPAAPALASCLRATAAAEAAAARLPTRPDGTPALPDYETALRAGSFQAAIRALCSAVGVAPPAAAGGPDDGEGEGEPVQSPATPRPLGPHGFALVLPALHTALAARGAHELQRAALGVVAAQVTAGPPALLPESVPVTFRALYAALEAAPAARERAARPLEALAARVRPGDDAALVAAAEGALSVGLGTRTAALRSLLASPAVREGGLGTAPARVVALVWLARHESTPEIVALADEAWEVGRASLPTEALPSLHLTLLSEDSRSRAVAARALSAAATGPLPGELGPTIRSALAAAQDGGSELSRLGAASLVQALAPAIPLESLPGALDAVLVHGMRDPSDAVRAAALAAGEALIDAHGTSSPDALLARLEAALDASRESAGGSDEDAAHRDAVRTGVVVLLGSLAPHLPAEHPRARGIVETLLDVLSTPSEAVQRAVSDRLPALMKAFSKDDAFVASTVERLLLTCLSGETYAARRGAAYGLAGAVRGLGIVSLRARGITDALKAGIENKGSPAAREGALCAYECLSEKLGRLFEPYVVATLPLLLASFGDPSREVRQAAQLASRSIMAQLSAQGVRLVLPSLLGGLGDRAWRTQEGSCQMLGAMAYCAPRQLGTCLPTVVPALGGALSDPHPRVAAAARAALGEVGSVIQNPEVSRLVPALIACITDPATNTKRMLDTLLATVFVNTVDIASLALVMPVALRGLKDRSGEVKRRAARIVGTLCGLANDPRDMVPYLDELLPALRGATADPLPEVRASAARALGSLVQALGREASPDLTAQLLSSLHAEGSGVERAGAAQALAEVLAVLGEDALAGLLPEVLEGTRSRAPAAREGCLTLFRYLPPAMPDTFRRHLADALPAVLLGLADEAEGVRDAALLAARVAVDLYATTALDLLLPAVEAGIASANWRIRQSSVELLGDLLFKVAGTSGKIQQDLRDDEGEGISAEAHGRLIAEALGWERRCEVLALVYMARSDVAYGVRSAALHVWKTVVTNTPKTLGEVLPALMAQVISALAASAEDRRDAAGRCLGELVRKMGERVLAQIVPILRDGMSDPEASTRQGVCNGLRDVVENATREQLATHLPTLLPAIQSALCDESAAVRAAAGAIFNVMHRTGGASAVDAVVPALLASLEGAQGRDAALDGLRVLLTVRPALLGAMLPRLVRPPISAENLRALGALAEAAGSTLPSHLVTVLPPLLELAEDHPDVSGTVAAAHDALRRVVLSVQEDGLHVLVEELLRDLGEPELAVGACRAISTLCRGGKLDFQEHVPALLGALVPDWSAEREELVTASWDAAAAVAGSIPKETQPSFVRCLKDAVASARDREKRKRLPPPLRVAGCCLPKGLQPILPIYLQGVLQGASAELRELAAEGLGELVDVTSPEALRPFVVQITGPLIRIMGDRFPWQIKSAILRTLGLLIGKAGIALKPFVPQLQATFLKCLLDPELKVRARAAANLGALSALSTRLDALVTDLATSAKSADPASGDAYVAALRGTLLISGARISPDALAKVGVALADASARAGDDEALRAGAADALGAWAAHAPQAELDAALVSAGVVGSGAAVSRSGDRLGAALTASALLRHSPSRVSPQLASELLEAVSSRFARDPLAAVRVAAAVAAGRLARVELTREGGPDPRTLARAASVLMALLGGDQASETQRCALTALRRLAAIEGAPEALVPFLGDLVPSVLRIVQDSTGSTKLLAERTLSRLLDIANEPETASDFLAGQGAGSMARQMLTDAYLRRLAKLPQGDDDDEFDV